MTALFVNLTFGGRFDHYLHQQEASRQSRIVAALEGSYVRSGGWSTDDLGSTVAGLIMDGGSVRLLDASGKEIWSITSDDPSGHHGSMMGTTGDLGPEVVVPLDAGGASAAIRLPVAGAMPNDVAFRRSVNGLLLAAGVIAIAVAALAALYLGKRTSTSTRALTEAARAMAQGDRGRRVSVSSADEFGEMASAFNSMADAVEQEDRLRKAFAADVAHELRTPLGILQGQIEGIQDGVLRPDGRTVASLKDEVIRLARSVADLEAMAAAEAATFSMEIEPVSIDEVVNGVLDEFEGRLNEKDVNVHTHLLPARVEGDRTRLHQIVANLLSNAVKFVPPGATVAISTGTSGQEAFIRVSDDGPGIAADDLPRVFDRFFRGSEAKASGSGIGLAVARGLAEAMRGTIEAESAPGEGATFTVRLPLLKGGLRRGAA